MPTTQILELSVIAPQLAQSPAEIVERRKQELTKEIKALAGHTWLHRLAAWRRVELEWRQRVDNEALTISLIGWSVCNILLAIGVTFLQKEVGAACLLSCGSIHGAWGSWAARDGCVANDQADKRIARRHLFILLLPPLMLAMPFIRIFDLVITSRWGRRFFDDDARVSALEAKRAELAGLTPSTLVPATYRTALLAARETFLGDSSELRKAEKDLAKRLEALCSQIERMKVRLTGADKDPDRVPMLQKVLTRMQDQRESLGHALETVRGTMAKTRAMLDEFQQRIDTLGKPLEDAEFVQQALQEEEDTADAIRDAYATVDQSPNYFST
ncbi:MAG: hypothetical protein AAB879_00405, partial [Patescibacteria group bacterium]